MGYQRGPFYFVICVRRGKESNFYHHLLCLVDCLTGHVLNQKAHHVDLYGTVAPLEEPREVRDYQSECLSF